MFDHDRDNIDLRELTQGIRQGLNTNVVIHKLTLAPEIDPEDSKAFTREIMQQIGSEKGLDLRWAAVIHENTDHHHLHVVVLSRDKSGKGVRFNRQDYELIKEYGDRYLEREQPERFRQAREARQARSREYLFERRRQNALERQERIAQLEELPWLHRNVAREMYEPFHQWKRRQLEEEATSVIQEVDASNEQKELLEKPPYHDTIRAAGKEWSQTNSIAQLRDLNEYL